MNDNCISFDDFFDTLQNNEEDDNWTNHWHDMPEFVCDDLQSYQSVIVHFETKEDRDTFSKLVNQKLTDKTKYIWYPKPENVKPKHFIYTNED